MSKVNENALPFADAATIGVYSLKSEPSSLEFPIKFYFPHILLTS